MTEFDVILSIVGLVVLSIAVFVSIVRKDFNRLLGKKNTHKAQYRTIATKFRMDSKQ